jgi:hypothetical protein
MLKEIWRGEAEAEARLPGEIIPIFVLNETNHLINSLILQIFLTEN